MAHGGQKLALGRAGVLGLLFGLAQVVFVQRLLGQIAQHALVKAEEKVHGQGQGQYRGQAQ